MSRPLKVAVISVGYLGRFHAEKYAQLDNVDIIGVCDCDESRCSEIASTLNCDSIFDYKELVGCVDAVSIVTPTFLHYEIASFFLDNGIHVLVEKPMTGVLAHAKALVTLAEKKQLILQVGFIERFNPTVQYCKQFVDQPLFIEAMRLSPFSTRSQDIDVIFDLMIHDIDLIQYLVGCEVTAVSACSAPVISSAMDIARVRLEFANGCTANITASRASMKSERRMRIFQKQRYTHLNLKDRYCSVTTIKPQTNFTLESAANSVDRIEYAADDQQADALLSQIQCFVDAVVSQRPSQVPGTAGVAALTTAFQIEAATKAHHDRYALNFLEA